MISENEAWKVIVNHRLVYDTKCHLFLTHRTFKNCFSGSPPPISMNNEPIFCQCTATAVVFLKFDIAVFLKVFTLWTLEEHTYDYSVINLNVYLKNASAVHND